MQTQKTTSFSKRRDNSTHNAFSPNVHVISSIRVETQLSYLQINWQVKKEHKSNTSNERDRIDGPKVK
ncbi:hypothetical protein BpHYR1_036768 [Brachionus plicatilis]|uniref:Uncharacterized protein n=1 Tax=Brachionus plicatilis TaxID=10195 RepID=A0A3M7SZR7_BRAPC|nr:hypothetical protein BpHYR1_036768 [Brachionus plicatilis]